MDNYRVKKSEEKQPGMNIIPESYSSRIVNNRLVKTSRKENKTIHNNNNTRVSLEVRNIVGRYPVVGFLYQ